jgi:O-antigen ligase
VLAGAGIDLGNRITPQPAAAGHAWAGQFLTGLVLLRILSLPDPGGRRVALAVGLVAAVLAYVALAWIRRESAGTSAADRHFGFFPNRNHSATLMAMGAVVATGLLLQAGRKRSGWLAGYALGAAGLLALALVFVNVSRAGILLLACGGVALLVVAGPRYLRGTGAKILGLSGLAVAVLFLIPDSAVKQRLESPVAGVPGWSEAGANGRLDGRLEIFIDGLSMLRAQPATGWGAGQFEHVFPQYRQLAANVNDSWNVHPESSWLWMATESGLPATLSLLALAGLAIGRGLVAARRGSERALRASCVVAAGLPLLHGFGDVPLHREPLLWLAGLLLVMGGAFRPVEPGRLAGPGWRVAGLAVLLAGGWLMHGTVTGAAVTPATQAAARFAEAQRLYALDQAAGGGAPAAGGRDPLEQALEELEGAIGLLPMDYRNHGLHGMLALHFDDKDARARADFARQRLLAPTWVRLPLIQADAWKKIRPEESAALLELALGRARARHGVPGSDPGLVSQTYLAVLAAARGDEQMEEAAVRLAAGDSALVTAACRSLPPASLARLEPLLGEMIRVLPDGAAAAEEMARRLGAGER